MDEHYEQSIDRGGWACHIRVDGPPDAPVVLMAHSLGMDGTLWDGVVPLLSGRFRLVRCDARGHGRSGIGPTPLTVEALSRDLMLVQEALDVERAHMVGVSMGGATVLHLAASAPERVGRLVAGMTAPRFPPPAFWTQRIADLHARGMVAAEAGALDRWLTADAPAALRDRLHRRLMSNDPAGYAACCAALRDMDLRSELGRITAPTLILAGQDDPSTPPASCADLAAAIPGAAFRVLPGAHLACIEHPAAFAQAVLEFLDEEDR